MDLYLVRHAIAELRDPDRWSDDSRRPLTKRGIRRFRKAARGLGCLVPEVDAVLASPFVRAWETALMLEEYAGWPHPAECRELIYDAPEALSAALRAYAGAGSLALVGHEPFLSRFASALLAPGQPSFMELKKGAVLRLQLERPGLESPACLVGLLQPRVLRALA